MKVHRVLIIGATGSVGEVVCKKLLDALEPRNDRDKEMASFDFVFTGTSKDTLLDLRVQIIAHQCEKWKPPIAYQVLDCEQSEDMSFTFSDFKPTLVINVGMPYYNLKLMSLCEKFKSNYLDTACYEPKDDPKYRHEEQWGYDATFKAKGITGIVGCGFDPGMTNAYVKHLVSSKEITPIDIKILDCNAGDHKQEFATNFNPELNIREITQKCRSYANKQWKLEEPMSRKKRVHFQEISTSADMYKIYHEELESLVKNFPTIETAEFFMSFSDKYLSHLDTIMALGLHKVIPIDHKGQKVIPVEFLKSLLPKPKELGSITIGKTWIGVVVNGLDSEGKKVSYKMFNVSDHEQAYKEVGSQGIAYTTAIPAVAGAIQLLNGTWTTKGVFNVEQMDVLGFLVCASSLGLPYTIEEVK